MDGNRIANLYGLAFSFAFVVILTWAAWRPDKIRIVIPPSYDDLYAHLLRKAKLVEEELYYVNYDLIAQCCDCDINEDIPGAMIRGNIYRAILELEKLLVRQKIDAYFMNTCYTKATEHWKPKKGRFIHAFRDYVLKSGCLVLQKQSANPIIL